MPLKKGLSAADQIKIKAFNDRVVGQMRRMNTGKDFSMVIFLDYKGDPCHSKNRVSTLFLKARPNVKGFAIYRNKDNDGKVAIQHDELLAKGVGARKAKAIGPSRNYKITRKAMNYSEDIK